MIHVYEKMKTNEYLNLFGDKYEFVDNFKHEYPIILIVNKEDDTMFEFREFLRIYIAN